MKHLCEFKLDNGKKHGFKFCPETASHIGIKVRSVPYNPVRKTIFYICPNHAVLTKRDYARERKAKQISILKI